MSTRTGTMIDDHARQVLVEAASLAPSVHNSQPWRFAVGERRIELYADPGRQLRILDGLGRGLLISCGAALFNLRVAAEHLGFHPRVRVLPSPDNPTLVAIVDIDHRHHRSGLLGELYPEVAARRTNRYPFWERPVPPSVIAGAVDAVEQEHGVLRVYNDPQEISRVVDLLHEAESAERTIPGALGERAAFIDTGAPGEGVPVESLGPLPVDHRHPYRDLGRRHADRERAPFEKAPTIAVLSTLADRPADWVRAGQALERALLVLTKAGVSASFMNQPLEHADLRFLVRSPTTGVGHPQMLLRVGYGIAVPPTPRRPLEEVTSFLQPVDEPIGT